MLYRLICLAIYCWAANALRLSREVIPSHQSFHLKFDIKEWKYTGETEIKIKILSTQSSIWLYCDDAVKLSKVILLQKNKNFPLESFKVDGRTSVLTIKPKEDVTTGDYLLKLTFSGTISESLQGMIKTGWVDEKGKKHPQITTHFEPDKARQAFPCFDEPSFKIMIKMVVDHPAGYRCNSASPLLTQKHVSKNVIRSEFEETEPMSIYLLAINVHDMTQVRGETTRGIPVSVLTPPHKKAGAQVTLEWAIKALDHFERYLDCKYPFKKLDLMGIYDFNAGGMENIGMIHLLYDCAYIEKESITVKTLLYCRVVIVHEVSHMWFGNLVSVKWWDDLWLKEGFARFITSYAMDQMKTDRKAGAHMFEVLDSSYVQGIEVDKFKFTKPVRQTLRNSYDAAAMFNSLSYAKGAFILKSVERLIGAAAFRTGLRDYFTKFKFKSANFDDFVACFGNIENGISVGDYMKKWLNQPGFPIITSERVGNTIKLEQTRFTESPKYHTSQSWYVPLNYKTEKSSPTSYRLMMEKNWVIDYTLDHGYSLSNTFSILNSNFGHWYVLDTDNIIFGLHQYEDDNYMLLARALQENPNSISDATKLIEITNLELLMENQRISPRILLETSRYVSKETNMDVVLKWLLTLLHMKRNLHDRDLYVKFNHYLRSLLIDKVRNAMKLSFDDTKAWNLRKNYSWLLILGVKWRVKEAIHAARELYHKFKAGNHINANFLGYILRHYIRKPSHWSILFKRLNSYPQSQKELRTMIRMLAKTDNESHQKLLLTYSRTSHIIPRSVVKSTLCYVAWRNPHLAWTYFKAHYEYYFRLYGESQFSMNSLLQCLVGNLNTREDYEDAKAFFKVNSAGTGTSGLKRGLKSANVFKNSSGKKSDTGDEVICITVKKESLTKSFSRWWEETFGKEDYFDIDNALDDFGGINED